MSYRKTMLWLLVVAIGVASPGFLGLFGDTEVMATKPLPHWGIDYSITPESLPTKSGAATLRLTVERWKDGKGCDSVIFMVTNKRGAAYSGPERWVVPLTEGAPYVCFVDFDIPDNDTCALIVAAGCRKMINEQRWFVTTGDTLEMYASHPAYARKYQPTWSDVVRAKFTPEQLQKEFDFRLDLRQAYPAQRDSVEMLFGILQSGEVPDVHIIRTTRDNWIKLSGDWQIRINPVDEDGFSRDFPPADWETPPPQQDSSETRDSSKPQGSLDGDPSLRDPTGAITLERVTGLTGANTLPINQTITYYLRLNNNTGYSAEGMTNGFRVYSPDGATWNESVGDTLGTRLS